MPWLTSGPSAFVAASWRVLGLGRLQAWFGDPTTRRSTSGPIAEGATPTSIASAATPASTSPAAMARATCWLSPNIDS